MECDGRTSIQAKFVFDIVGCAVPRMSIVLSVVERTSNMLDLRDHLLPP